MYSGDLFYRLLAISMMIGMIGSYLLVGLGMFMAEFVRRLKIKIKRQKGGKI
jgi:ABC-type lipoprotein release transport system permease subunit